MADPSARLQQRIRLALNDSLASKELIAQLGADGVGASQVLTGGNTSDAHPNNELDDENSLLDGSGGASSFIVPTDGDYVLEATMLIQVTVTA